MITRIITGDLQVNTYLYNFKDNSALIIDPGAESLKIINAIKKSNLTLVGILLTHGHFDHIGAVSDLKNEFNVPIYIHKDDSSLLGDKSDIEHKKMFKSFGPQGDYLFKSIFTKSPEPDILLMDGDYIGNTELTVIHTPGHSMGSICFYSKEKGILFSGDTLFKGSYGRTDFPGGNLGLMTKSLNCLLQLPKDTTVYPGHGEKTSIEKESRLLG